jgi:hypothetical protein
MLVVEHRNIGQELVHRKLQVHLMRFRTLAIAFVDSVVDNPSVVVGKQQLNHAEVVLFDHLLLRMDHCDNSNKHHNHYLKTKESIYLSKEEKII